MVGVKTCVMVHDGRWRIRRSPSLTGDSGASCVPLTSEMGTYSTQQNNQRIPTTPATNSCNTRDEGLAWVSHHSQHKQASGTCRSAAVPKYAPSKISSPGKVSVAQDTFQGTSAVSCACLFSDELGLLKHLHKRTMSGILL